MRGAFASSGNMVGGNETTIISLIQMMLIDGMIAQGSTTGDHYGPVAVAAPDEKVFPQCRALAGRVARLAERVAKPPEWGEGEV